jgi:hypothetical protein
MLRPGWSDHLSNKEEDEDYLWEEEEEVEESFQAGYFSEHDHGDEELDNYDWQATENCSDFKLCQECRHFWGRAQTNYVQHLKMDHKKCAILCRKAKAYREIECPECHGIRCQNWMTFSAELPAMFLWCEGLYEGPDGQWYIETCLGTKEDEEGDWAYLPHRETQSMYGEILISLPRLGEDEYAADNIFQYITAPPNWEEFQPPSPPLGTREGEPKAELATSSTDALPEEFMSQLYIRMVRSQGSGNLGENEAHEEREEEFSEEEMECEEDLGSGEEGEESEDERPDEGEMPSICLPGWTWPEEYPMIEHKVEVEYGVGALVKLGEPMEDRDEDASPNSRHSEGGGRRSREHMAATKAAEQSPQTSNDTPPNKQQRRDSPPGWKWRL